MAVLQPSGRFTRWLRSLALVLGVLAFAGIGWTSPPPAKKPVPHRPAKGPKKPARTVKKPGTKLLHPKLGRTIRRVARKHNSSRPVAFTALSPVKGSEHYVQEGALPEPLEGATCPDDMANVDDRFCIDVYEASLVDAKSGQPWSAFEAVPETAEVKAVSAPGVFPVGYISGGTAEKACRNAGKRLCSPTEWRKACYGPDDVMFGYGPRREERRCNDHGKSPMMHYYPQVEQSWALVGAQEMNDPRLNQLEGTLMKTGENPGCTNGYGVFDMVGNLHEWTSEPSGTFQGGYYLDTHINGDGCSYRTTAHGFGYHDYSTGFRCCGDPTGDDE